MFDTFIVLFSLNQVKCVIAHSLERLQVSQRVIVDMFSALELLPSHHAPIQCTLVRIDLAHLVTASAAVTNSCATQTEFTNSADMLATSDSTLTESLRDSPTVSLPVQPIETSNRFLALNLDFHDVPSACCLPNCATSLSPDDELTVHTSAKAPRGRKQQRRHLCRTTQDAALMSWWSANDTQSSLTAAACIKPEVDFSPFMPTPTKSSDAVTHVPAEVHPNSPQKNGDSTDTDNYGAFDVDSIPLFDLNTMDGSCHESVPPQSLAVPCPFGTEPNNVNHAPNMRGALLIRAPDNSNLVPAYVNADADLRLFCLCTSS